MEIRMEQTIMQKIMDACNVQTREAAALVGATIEKEKMVYLVSGDMHSNGVYAPFFVPGMLCALSPMTEPTLSNTVQASRAHYLRNVEHIGEFLCGYFRSLREGDCILIADCTDSRATEEILTFAKEHGISTIHVSPAPKAADVQVALPACEDKALELAAHAGAIGPITFEILDEARRQLKDPDVWLEFTQENEAQNEELIQKYRDKIKKL